MEIRFIQVNEGMLKIESNANDKQWKHIVKWINENTNKSMSSVINELKSFDSFEIKIIL